MSHLHDIIDEQRDNITGDIIDAINNITPKYVLRIACSIIHADTDHSEWGHHETAAFDTMSAVEDFVSRELEKLEQVKQSTAYYHNASVRDYEAIVYASCRRVDCIITPPQRIRFLSAFCTFVPAAWQGKYAWFADEDFDAEDVALDTPEREIVKRRKARIEHENRNK